MIFKQYLCIIDMEEAGVPLFQVFLLVWRSCVIMMLPRFQPMQQGLTAQPHATGLDDESDFNWPKVHSGGGWVILGKYNESQPLH